MRFQSSSLLFVVASLFAPAVGAQAQPRVIDQSAPPADVTDAPFTWAIGGGSSQILYQMVTAGIDGRLMEVRVPLACATGTLRLEIRDVDAAGLPGGSVLRARAFPATRFPGPVTDEYRVLAVRPPLPLNAGDRFAITLSNETGACGVWPSPTGDTYPGGQGYALAAPNVVLVPLGLGTGREDLPFETVVHPRR